MGEGVEAVREKLGFETFGETANQMRRTNVIKKHVRKIRAELEAAVLDSLMYLLLEK